MISLRHKTPKVSLDSLLDELIDNPSDIDKMLVGHVRADNIKSSSSVKGLPSFLEVNAFIDKHNRVPDFNSADFNERSLATRMNSYACHANEYQELIRYDKHNLINPALCQKLVSTPIEAPLPTVMQPLFINDDIQKVDIDANESSIVESELDSLLNKMQGVVDGFSDMTIALDNDEFPPSTDVVEFTAVDTKEHPEAVIAVNQHAGVSCINISYHKAPVSYACDAYVKVGSLILNGFAVTTIIKPKLSYACTWYVEANSIASHGLPASATETYTISHDDVFLSIDGDVDASDDSDDFYLSIDGDFSYDATDSLVLTPLSEAALTTESTPISKPLTIDDILDNDLDFLESLSAGTDEYFDIESKYTDVGDRAAPDEIGKQTACADFYMYEATFEALHAKLESGELKTVRFSGSNIKQGDSFILNGIIGFVQAVGETRTDNAGNYDPRLHLIFDNGTESNILLRTLTKNLYTDKLGKSIIRSADDFTDFDAHDTVNKIRTGQVYIVRSLSNNPKLRQIPDLYKIGFTKHTAQERTKNASRDTAFLEAPVEIIARADCYDLDPRGLEGLIHNFLAAQRIHVTLTSKDGKQYYPQEWFSINLSDAKKIIKHIVDQTIVDYRMDNTTNRLVAK